MRLWRRRPYRSTDDAQAAAVEATRALRDAEALTCRADELGCRAGEVADRLSQRRERNHFGEAIARAIRGT